MNALQEKACLTPPYSFQPAKGDDLFGKKLPSLREFVSDVSITFNYKLSDKMIKSADR